MSRRLDETSVPQPFGQVIYGLPMEVKKISRKIEKLLYKYNSADTAIKFDEMCLKEGLLPK